MVLQWHYWTSTINLVGFVFHPDYFRYRPAFGRPLRNLSSCLPLGHNLDLGVRPLVMRLDVTSLLLYQVQFFWWALGFDQGGRHDWRAHLTHNYIILGCLINFCFKCNSIFLLSSSTLILRKYIYIELDIRNVEFHLKFFCTKLDIADVEFRMTCFIQKCHISNCHIGKICMELNITNFEFHTVLNINNIIWKDGCLATFLFLEKVCLAIFFFFFRKFAWLHSLIIKVI